MGWISVEDRLPEEDEFVDVNIRSKKNLDYNVRETDVRFHYKQKTFSLSDCYEALYVSHWMPLPSPPEA